MSVVTLAGIAVIALLPGHDLTGVVISVALLLWWLALAPSREELHHADLAIRLRLRKLAAWLRRRGS